MIKLTDDPVILPPFLPVPVWSIFVLKDGDGKKNEIVDPKSYHAITFKFL